MACDSTGPSAAPVSGTSADVQHVETIVCKAAWRKNVSTSDFDRRRVVFNAEPAADPQTKRWSFPGVRLQVSYSYDGHESPSIIFKLTYPGSDKAVGSSLYQLVVIEPGDPPVMPDQLAGGGFTGLQSASPPGSSADLQYWCLARAEGGGG